MIKQRNKIRSILLLCGDLTAIIIAFLCAYKFRGAFPKESFAELFPFSWYVDILMIILPTWCLVFYLTGLYRYWRGPGFWKEVWMEIKAIFVASFLLGFAVFALRYHFVSRIFIFSFALFDLVLVVSFRWSMRKAIQFVTRKGNNFRMILVVGTNQYALDLAQSVEKDKDLGLRLLGLLETRNGESRQGLVGYPVLGKANELPKILEGRVVDEVIFAISQEELKDMENLFLLCEERGITTRVILKFFPQVISKTHLEEMDGIPLLTFTTTPKNELLLFIRRVLDLAGSLALIVGLSPLFLLIIILIRIDTPGPAFYRQVRCGLNGRKFTLLKFRSMIREADEKKTDLIRFNLMNGPVFKMKNDPRITRVGRVLRRISLDELPQLINVFKGDMSFVGPRPPIPEEVGRYEGWQRRRLSMKPGITGLWQVSGRNKIDFQQWIKLDLQYIDNWSMWLDFKILLKTIPVVISGKGAM
jgi:exopolysaccharide biosynthesis polyprenyl glycosylphosphotransferase